MSSAKISSTTLAPPKLGNKNDHHHQSSLTSCGKSGKSKTPREVVLHHPMAAPPPEDWILFPSDVIVTKNSTVRPRRSRKIKDSQSEDSRRPWIKLDATKGKIEEWSHVCQDMQRCKKTPSIESTSPHTVAPACEGNRCGARMQPKPKFPERLPTPDLSDIEEDSFWSCCGSSEGGA